MEQTSLPEKAYQLAFDYEKQFGGCAQAVLSALKDVFGSIPDEVIKSAHAFAGGGALTTEGTCGALNGGYMAISFYLGRPREGFGKGSFSRSYKLSKKLHGRFVKEYGSALCPDVQTHLMGRPFDLWNRDDYQRFEKAGAHADRCTSVAGSVARWTAEVLLEEGVVK